MRSLAPAWYDAINAGKQSVVCDLKADADFGRELCASADVVLEGFRPGIAERLGVGYDRMPRGVIYCSISGYGSSARTPTVPGHDLNYQGYAGVLADTAPGLPPVQVADLAGGALVAVTEILACASRTRANRSGPADRALAHTRRPPSRLPPGCRTRSPACSPVASVVRDLRNRGWPLPDGRRPGAEVLRAPVRVDRRARTGRAPVRPRRTGRARGHARRRVRDKVARRRGSSSSTAKTCPSARLRRSRKRLSTSRAPSGPPPAVGEHTDAWRSELGL